MRTYLLEQDFKNYSVNKIKVSMAYLFMLLVPFFVKKERVENI